MDSGPAKLYWIREWAREQQEEHGEPPLVWYDKLCVHPNDTRSNLICLPVFVAGCKQILALVGHTYTSRLWCVLELFVFNTLDIETNDVVVKLLESPTDPQFLRSLQRRFSASKASCRFGPDREALLATIEEALGSLTPFNERVNAIFKDVLLKLPRSSLGEQLPRSPVGAHPLATPSLPAARETAEAALDAT